MTSKRNVMVWFSMVCLATISAAPSYNNLNPPLELDIIDLAAISRMTPQQLEQLAEGLAAEEIMRTKRSSAQELTASLVSKASQGIQSKVGLLGQASAGITNFVSSASASSSAKSSGHSNEGGYSYEPHQEDNKVDFWGIKKSIFSSLLQAVKAITGGVTIIKGQLIKGGGALAATLGKVISGKGDVVSNIGKKIVNSAALSQKRPESHAGYAPPPSHVDFPPSSYGAPTGPAHFHSGPSAPSGFAAHKFPAPLDGRNKLHAGLVILTPLDEAGSEPQPITSPGHTPLEPPQNILHTAFNAIKNVISSVAPSLVSDSSLSNKPTPWGAVNSYGEAAMYDTYSNYEPQYPPLDYRSPSLTYEAVKVSPGLTPEKLQKINANLKKVQEHIHGNIQRSSEDLPQMNILNFLKKGPVLSTPVVRDDEIGVLPGDLLPTGPSELFSTTTTSTTTTENPMTTISSTANRRKDVKFILRGNKIVQL